MLRGPSREEVVSKNDNKVPVVLLYALVRLQNWFAVENIDITTFINFAAEETSCPDLVPPKNGEVRFTTKVGDTATYTCSDGYILSGNSMRLCLPGGIWNGTEPICNRKMVKDNSPI